MTITINATSGSSTANSYVTLAEADYYFETHLQFEYWDELDDEKKKAALVAATRQLDTNLFLGRRVEEQQALAWPRLYIYDYDAFQVTGVPVKVKNAQCEIAIWNLTEEDRIAGQFELENMDSVDIGPLKFSVNKENKPILPKKIMEIFQSIGPNVIKSSSALTSKIMVI